MIRSLEEQRRGLPDQPGVYLLTDADGRAIYVGKARLIRKRVAAHAPCSTRCRAGRRGAGRRI